MSSHFLDRSKCKPRVGLRFKAGDQIFELGGALGDGAAGLVRRAQRLRDKHTVAIKFLAPDSKYIAPETFDDVAARFRREGERSPNLDHAHLVKVLSYSSNEDGSAFEPESPDVQNPFIVMEHIPGRPLESYIRNTPEDQRGRFVVDEPRLRMAVQLASALHYLHSLHIVHRDVKPANIFVSKEEYVPTAILGDFGIMKWGDFQAALSSGTLTATSQRGLGTLKYMSPEQAVKPKDVTVRSDIYSLGITLYELFTGQILGSLHNVIEITLARLERGTTMSRYYRLGVDLHNDDADIAGIVLDMMLRGATGRPSSERLLGKLSFEFEHRFGRAWDARSRRHNGR